MSGQRTFEVFNVGDSFETAGRTVTEADIRAFVGATGSTDPIHVDHEYADKHPLVEGVVAQGTLTLGVVDGLVAGAVAGDAALAMNVGQDGIRYPAPVRPGDTISATAEVVETTRKDEDWGVVVTDVTATNQSRTTVFVETHRFLIATVENPALPDGD
jgi:acyl dehydratase